MDRRSSQLVFEEEETPTAFAKVNTTLKAAADIANRLGHRAPYERMQDKKSQEPTANTTVFENVNKTLKDAADITKKFGHKAPYERMQENTTTQESVEEKKQVTMDTVAAANTVGLEMKPLVIMLDNEGGVVDDQTSEEDQSLKIDNSAVIAIYPQLDELEEVIHSYNMDVMFLDTPNMPGYLVGQVLEKGRLNTELSFTIDLKGNYMSPDEKIFVRNAKTVAPIAIKLSNMKFFEEIIAGKHADADLSGFDMYSKEDKEISKLINLATLPEIVGSANRNKVISFLLKDGFQTALANALKINDQAYFIFVDYKSPNSFKLVSMVSNKNIVIVYNGKTAVLTHS